MSTPQEMADAFYDTSPRGSAITCELTREGLRELARAVAEQTWDEAWRWGVTCSSTGYSKYDDLDRLAAENRILREAVENAPHGIGCNLRSWQGTDCDCWKADALTRIGETDHE